MVRYKDGYKGYPKFNIGEREGILEEIYVSPLDHIMVKFYYPHNKTWTTINIGKLEEIILPNLHKHIIPQEIIP